MGDKGVNAKRQCLNVGRRADRQGLIDIFFSKWCALSAVTIRHASIPMKANSFSSFFQSKSSIERVW